MFGEIEKLLAAGSLDLLCFNLLFGKLFGWEACFSGSPDVVFWSVGLAVFVLFLRFWFVWAWLTAATVLSKHTPATPKP